MSELCADCHRCSATELHIAHTFQHGPKIPVTRAMEDSTISMLAEIQ